MILANFFSVHKDFHIKPSFFSSLSLVLFSSASVLQFMIWQLRPGDSRATSHMRMKARKERTRWHQKICLSRSLVVKLAIWLPAGRWGTGWRAAQHHCKGRRILSYNSFCNLLERKNLHMEDNGFSDLTFQFTVTGNPLHLLKGAYKHMEKLCIIFEWPL